MKGYRKPTNGLLNIAAFYRVVHRELFRAIASFATLVLCTSVTASQSSIEYHNISVNVHSSNADGLARAGDKAGAIEQYLYALELDPENSALFFGVASYSFDLNRYTDAVWAYREAVRLGEQGNANFYAKYGVALLVLGDYEGGFGQLNEGLRRYPNDDNLRSWRVGAAFAIGGYMYARNIYLSAPPSGWADPGDTRYPVMGLSHWTIVELDRRARVAGLKFPRLAHLSAIARVLQAFIGMGGLDFNRDELIRKKWDTIWQAIDLYRSLPLKPAPPLVAVQKLQNIEKELRQGRQPSGAVLDFQDAIDLAPWWPEAHYNFAVFARDSIYTLNLRQPHLPGEYFDNRRISAQEFVFYLKLSPGGEKAREACQQLKKWGLKCPV